MSGMFIGHSHGGHGHSHAHGEECGGSHGHDLENMPHEMKERLLKQIEERLQTMERHNGHHSHRPPNGRPPFGHHPTEEEVTTAVSYNPCLYGYGHESPSVPNGWESLATISSSVCAENTKAGTGWTAASDQSVIPVRDNFWLLRAPCFGRLRVVKDSQGWLMASLIVLYWVYGNWSTWNAILIPYYYDGAVHGLFLLLYAFVSVMCIASFICASTFNPGSLPQMSVAEIRDDWTECKTCLMKRPPLCHHCRRCGQCVRRMDHHCPWINNCVGEENQFAFLLLLIYASLLSLNSLLLQIAYFFWLGDCLSCDSERFVIRYRTAVLLLGVPMAFFMMVSMAGLFASQHISVLHGTTTLEWMKIQQKVFLTGIIPEQIPERTKSCRDAYSIVCGGRSLWVWMIPCRKRSSTGGKTLVA